MRMNRLKTLLAGTATLLTIMATNVAHVQADTTDTAKSDADTTVASDSTVKPAKKVVLQNASSSSQSNGESTARVSSGSSTSVNGTANTNAAVTASVGSDTTEQATEETHSMPSANSASSQVSTQAKSQRAADANQQSNVTMYDAVTTSHKGAGQSATDISTNDTTTPVTTGSRRSLRMMSPASLSLLAARAEIAVNGIGADDAVITGADGTTYKASDVLSLYDQYTVAYNWNVSSDVNIQPGDTATITLPGNVIPTSGMQLVVPKDGETAYTINIDKDSKTGTITFGDYFANHQNYGPNGKFSFSSTGTQKVAGNDQAKINKVGWIYGDTDANGNPKQLNWQVVANLGSEDWRDVTISDQLGNYQTHTGVLTLETGRYVDGAFVKSADLGTYDFSTGQFTYASGVSAPKVEVTLNGQQVSVTLDHITTAINMFYQVDVQPGHMYANNADVTYTPNDGSGTGGSGGSTDPVKPKTEGVAVSNNYGIKGDYDDVPYQLVITKLDADTNTAVSGATYDLFLDEAGKNVFQTGLVTDANGEIHVTNLSAGTYWLKEVAAPAGYLLDQTMQPINVDADHATDAVVTFTVKDQKVAKQTIKVVKTWQDVPTGVTTPAITVTLKRNGEVYQTLTLNADNQYTGAFNDLDVTDVNGTAYQYTVDETTPTGYVSSQTTTANTVAITNTYQTTHLTIKKVDQQSNQPLAGATFTVTDAKGAVVKQVTTDATGTVNVNGLAQGEYTVQETGAPAGYNVDSKRLTAQLTADNQYQAVLTFTDTQKTGELTIKKVDQQTQQPLANATFEIKSADGKFDKVLTTDATGVISLSGLAQGEYTVQETKAPAGYTVASGSQTFSITTDDKYAATLTFDDTKITGQLTIKKVDQQTQQPLAGAIFEVKSADGKFDKLVTTDATGVVKLSGLAQGDYTVQETKAPTGYTVASGSQTFSITTDDKYAATLTFDDTKITGQLTIKKVDQQTKQPLADAIFEVKSADGKFDKILTTDINGTASLSGLAQGEYTVQETQAPAGYTVASGSQTFSITTTDNYQAVLTFNDTAITGSLSLVKLDQRTKQPLAGATFDIKDTDGKVVTTLTTGTDGKASVDGLAQGNYTVQETQAPLGYTAAVNSQKFSITTANNYQAALTFNDTKITGHLSIVKLDQKTQGPLAGAVFEIRDVNGQMVARLTTDEAGYASVADLAQGDYTVQEITAPTGYRIDSASQAFTIVPADNYQGTLVFTDTKLTGQLTIVKLDQQTQQPLAGAIFAVVDANGNEVTRLTTAANGRASVTGLAQGAYTVQEISAPRGYQLDATSQTFNITTADDYQATLTFSDTAITGGLTIKKVDQKTQAPLAGATFTITDAKGQIVKTVTTDATGTVSVAGLAQGDYTVQETSAPAGYQLDQTEQTAAVTAANNYQVTLTFSDVLRPVVPPMTGRLTIKKVAQQTQQPLAGATFTITDAKGQVVKTVTTDATGSVSVDGLAQGDYTVQEISAPTGYQLDPTAQTPDLTAITAYQATLTFADAAKPQQPLTPVDPPKTPTTPKTPTVPAQPGQPVEPTTPTQPTEPITPTQVEVSADDEVTPQVVTPTVVRQARSVTPQQRATTAKKLPQTDEHVPVWAQLLGFLMLMVTLLGVGFTRQRG